MTRGPLPRLQTSMTSWPARSSSVLMRAAQYASEDHPRVETRCTIFMRRCTRGARSSCAGAHEVQDLHAPVHTRCRIFMRRCTRGAGSSCAGAHEVQDVHAPVHTRCRIFMRRCTRAARSSCVSDPPGAPGPADTRLRLEPRADRG